MVTHSDNIYTDNLVDTTFIEIVEEPSVNYALKNPYICSPMNYIGGKY